ncbi:hypothetical protein J2W48_004153 [Flavobacterium piscis]|uniref:Uncharacterized protein n=1 Tax=Flavobacterium piscis TaxID=1114874 RepID=A0ABU1YD78_9FLAO|nr:hypothetical protein [Flavobacterium piscis]
MILFFFSLKRIFELIVILLISFLIFSIQFGGLPHGEWVALNLYPAIGGLLTWVIFNIILFWTKKNDTKDFKYYFCFILFVVPSIMMILFLLKKM